MSKPLRWAGTNHYAACHRIARDDVVRLAAHRKRAVIEIIVYRYVGPFSSDLLDTYREEATQRLIADICSIERAVKR
jgi:TPP-dependent pyruvate/acetoin dehydrogenase alpha subunit